ncbi:hypothetical protein H8356DRAFT_1431118 [Neocallimastix lanati (nom. inval.)]|nr:hypothetical protein H8356DRAFT_1431118 [Neocallimastix sp. JGI-2020a]
MGNKIYTILYHLVEKSKPGYLCFFLRGEGCIKLSTLPKLCYINVLLSRRKYCNKDTLKLEEIFMSKGRRNDIE